MCLSSVVPMYKGHVCSQLYASCIIVQESHRTSSGHPSDHETSLDILNLRWTKSAQLINIEEIIFSYNLHTCQVSPKNVPVVLLLWSFEHLPFLSSKSNLCVVV